MLAPLWSACGETATTDYSEAAVSQSDDECISPKAAYEKLVAGENVVLLDVRYLWERLAAGYPDGDEIGGPAPFVPFFFPLPKVGFPREVNEDFVGEVEDRFSDKDLVITFCRDRARGAQAAAALIGVGIPAMNMCGGFDGDDKDDSGHRTCNGWKNTPRNGNADPRRDDCNRRVRDPLPYSVF